MKYKIGDIVRIKKSLDFDGDQLEVLFMRTDAKILAIGNGVVTLENKKPRQV